MPKPIVVLSPAPQQRDRIFSPDVLDRLHQSFDIVDLEAHPDLDLDTILPNVFAIVGHPDLSAERLERAQNLRAILNVEGNFLQNVDYSVVMHAGIRVLGCGAAYGPAVSEYALGLALDLCRGISREDRAARAGTERYFAASNVDSLLLHGAPVGILGFGNLGRATRNLLTPFRGVVRVFDPWLPESVLRDADTVPASLEETLAESKVVFVFVTATPESEHLLDARALALLPDGARLILVSRAPVVDYEALLAELRSGRIYAGIDVWPAEPLEPDSAYRTLDNVILSSHRAGALSQAHRLIGEMVLDDLELMARGLAPVRMQQANLEVVGKYRNRPVQ